ncbi:MAG: phenylalanine--tRNA ligase subunit alpha [Rickettsiales bacterium]|jgi:phenylalanyl-tRNA synthetase alpha chain|nr:phenylalanine--tRNA ligase subunit alpha [Rickettsiales bacterium]
MTIESIKKNFLDRLDKVENPSQIRNLRADFLGKKSEIGELMKELNSLSLEQRRDFGSKINELKDFISQEIDRIENNFNEEKIRIELQSEALDLTLPPRQTSEGLLHPMSKVQRELRDIMYSMGFSETNGSELETDWNCFGGLNIPPDHPARQMQDTFYLKNDEDEKIILRTQTTSLQMREMPINRPPFKFFTTGKTFRSEMDATHSPMFHQMDVVYIDENINLQDLKDCLITVIKKFFGIENASLRFRPSYFPFTSPSIEVDLRYRKTDGKKLIFGEGDNWMEVLGAGMVHPTVLKNAAMDPEKHQGFAFAFGIERLAMLKYGIGDIRNLYDGDILFLRHYGFKIFE